MSSALEFDGATMGLRRVVVPTAVGMVTVRAGCEEGGPATVLLHGAAGSWSTWTPLLAAARRAGAPLTDVVAIDLPGWGESPGPVPDAARLACTVADVVRALGYDSWRVVGHSLGATVALDVAARFPRQTVGVGLVSPTGAAITEVVRHPVRGAVRLPGFAGMLLAMRLLRALGPATPPLLQQLRSSGMLRLLSRPLFRHPSSVDRSVPDALADEIRPASFLAAAEAARTHDDALWRRIHSPVRSVRGRHDVFAGRGDGAALARRIPDVGEVVLDGVGHFAHIEDPAAVLAALGPVLRAPARPSASAQQTGPEQQSLAVSPPPTLVEAPSPIAR